MLRRHRLAAAGALAASATGLALASPAAHADDGADAQLVLVLDASSSMLEADASGGTRIDAARGALTTVVDQLQPDQRVGFRVFGATVVGLDDPAACTDSQLLVPIGTDNRDQLHAAVGQYAPFGETPIGYALQQAAGDLGAEGQRSILLVSDGESNCEPDPCTVAAELAAQGIDLTINVVGLNVDDVARQQLQCIASVGRGTYFDADDAQSLAAALDSLATRAFRPFSIDGTPVEGTPTADGAPALTPGEQYTDAIAEPGVSRTYLVEREIPRSSIHVGFTALPPAGVGAQVEVALSTPDGDDCASAFPDNATGTTPTWSLMSGSAISSATSTGCVDAEAIVLTVATTDAGTAESTGVPYELVIIEEPPVADPAALPPSANEAQREWVLGVPTDGAGGPVVAGSSFNDAPALTPGSYTSDILTGEHQLFRVPVEWGQELHVQARFETPGPAEAAALPAAPTARVYLYNPTRGPVTDAFSRGDGVGYHEPIRTDQPTLLSAAAPEVRWRNREWLLGNDTASVAGDYFVAVSLDPAEGGAAFTLPYTLTIETMGTAGAGAPAYEDGAEPTGVTTLGEAAGTASTGLIVGLAGGGSGLIGAGTFGLRRWSRDRPKP